MDSPLQEADPKALDTLMAKDPLKLTDQEIEAIVIELRRARKQMIEKDEKKISGKKIQADASLSLESLLGSSF